MPILANFGKRIFLFLNQGHWRLRSNFDRSFQNAEDFKMAPCNFLAMLIFPLQKEFYSSNFMMEKSSSKSSQP